MRIGLCLGVFDTFHYGHLRFIQRAAEGCDRLTVAVVGDKGVKAKKGMDRPLIPWEQREAIVRGLKGVAATFHAEDFDPSECVRYLRTFATDLVFFKGEDQAHVPTDGLGVSVVVIPRTPGVSTTALVNRLRS